ncbi:hypothetical protein QUS78_22405, partial [Xanthomonas citri pv. citri]
DMLLAVPGFAILLVVLLGGSVALGMLCARFRDIGSAIVSGLQFIFFLTPIIWTEDAVRGTAFHWLFRANPFATLLSCAGRCCRSRPTRSNGCSGSSMRRSLVPSALAATRGTATAWRTGCEARMSPAAHIVLRNVSV